LAVLANKVRTDMGTRLTAPNPTLTKQEQLDVDALSRAIITIASGVTLAANNKALGNRASFDVVVSRIGFKTAGAKAKHVRVFEVRSTAKGVWYILGPVEKGLGRVTYTFEMGICTALNVMPATWGNPISLPSPEFYIGTLPIGTIFAIRFAAVIVPAHKKATGGGTGTGGTSSVATQRSVTQTTGAHAFVTVLPVNAQGKVYLTYGVPFIQFSDPIWVAAS
jgi:hypothetical protein